MSGDNVTITGEVKRIVNLWPAGTSSFFVMGAGDLIVGLATNNPGTMNSWTQLFYPDCVNIPALGGTNPSIEDIINLDPDLVIIHPTTAAAGFAQQIRDVGIPAININFTDYETMVQAYTVLGEVLGGEYQKRLSAWCSAVETRLADVRGITTGIAEANRPVVYYIAGQSDSLVTTMAANSIVSDWVGSAGGAYAAGVMKLTGGQVTPEAVFAVNPDVIICGGVYQHVEKHAVETTAGWKDLKAVTTGRVYTNPYACFNWDRFGLESQLQLHYALLCIQPEIAAANGITRETMISEIVDFYKTYTDYELTRTQAEHMLDGLRADGTAEFPVQ
jgi:iron complex transport system substrate-binding protein